jgi:hypothetical protein
VKVTRPYKNGIVVEVEAADMTDVVKSLAFADDVFSDLVCAAEIDGKIHTSDNVSFVHRVVGKHQYFEMVCKDKGPLHGFKKRLGQYDGDRRGMLFSKNRPAEGEVPGLNGWSKYVAPNDGPAIDKSDF